MKSLLLIVCWGMSVPIFAKNAVTYHSFSQEGSVERDNSFVFDLENGLRFCLCESDPWIIKITHQSAKDRDLVYPVNPPYRFSGHLMVGNGYGEDAQSSVKKTPREFRFIYRPSDIATAWATMDKILWPGTFKEPEVEAASDTLEKIPTGEGKLEILSAKIEGDSIHELKFKVTLHWPK